MLRAVLMKVSRVCGGVGIALARRYRASPRARAVRRLSPLRVPHPDASTMTVTFLLNSRGAVSGRYGPAIFYYCLTLFTGTWILIRKCHTCALDLMVKSFEGERNENIFEMVYTLF